jgi:hypothetical protein
MFSLLVSWNEFTRTGMEAPLDGSITRPAYRVYTRSRLLQRTYTRVQIINDVPIDGHGD